MISRIVTCTIDPEKISEFKSALNDNFLPRIQSQSGFIDNLESLDPVTGEFCCTTLWESAADVQNYDQGLFQELAASLSPLLKEQPSVRTLPVENSSLHNIKAGRAAA
jgi:quinol monooxygenase YgiN